MESLSMQPFQSYQSIVLFGIFSYVISHVCAKLLVFYREARVKRQYASLKERGKQTRRTVPLSLITGPLGAGKTTLCNHLLSEADKRIAVIVNEIGDISIDHDLLVRKHDVLGDSKGIFVLKNGCICCSTATSKGISEMERVLDVLTKLVESDMVDHVIVETSGMADPVPLIQLLYQLQVEGGAFKLDAVITVVDAKHLHLHKHESEPFEQLLSADVVVINKVDLVEEAELEIIMRDIRLVNPAAKVIETTRSQVPTTVLNQAAFSLSSLRSRQQQAEVTAANWNERSDRVTVGTHKHTKGIEAVALETHDGPLNFRKFDDWLDSIVEKQWEDLYRLKGILVFEGRSKQTVIHGVHANIQVGAGKRLEPFSKESEWSRIVFIGKNLDQDALNEGFLSCVIRSKQDSKLN